MYALRLFGATMELSLFEKLGGSAAVDAAVEELYVRILLDPKLAPFFIQTDITALKKHQLSFLTMAFGGPTKYEGQDLTDSHSHLVKKQGLSDQHFDAVAGHLKDTLTELNVPEELVGEVMAIVAGTRDAVLGRVPKKEAV